MTMAINQGGNAGHLIYPLRVEQDRLYTLLTKRIGPLHGRTPATAELASAISTLGRCETLARSLTPFDPSGL